MDSAPQNVHVITCPCCDHTVCGSGRLRAARPTRRNVTQLTQRRSTSPDARQRHASNRESRAAAARAKSDRRELSHRHAAGLLPGPQVPAVLLQCALGAIPGGTISRWSPARRLRARQGAGAKVHGVGNVAARWDAAAPLRRCHCSAACTSACAGGKQRRGARTPARHILRYGCGVGHASQERGTS